MRNRFHSICPYFAMFPETFAERWIGHLSRPGDVVLDPFSGRGTTAFQSLLMGRDAIASDVNDVAYCLTRAKTAAPALDVVLRRLIVLSRGFDGRQWWATAQRAPEFFRYAYAPRVLQQLCYLRSRLKWRTSDCDALIAAMALGSLHGEMDKSASYFSNQMPRTISTKPAYSVRFWKKRKLVAPERDVFALLVDRSRFRYETPPPSGSAITFHSDMRKLPELLANYRRPINLVITSPPYFDVTNFEEDQWLRLWFLGGPTAPCRNRLSRDDRYSFAPRYWSFIADMWRSLGGVVAPKGNVIVRIGSPRIGPDRLERMLTASAVFSGRRVAKVSVAVSEIRRRQTDQFRPGTRGCSVEVDCHYRFKT